MGALSQAAGGTQVWGAKGEFTVFAGQLWPESTQSCWPPADVTQWAAGIIGLPMIDPATDGEFLKTFLAERDAPCPNCGYNLRSLTSDRCPECAESLRLQVGLHEPRLLAYLTGMIGLASGAGFGGMLLIYAIYESLTHHWGRVPDAFMIITGTGFVVHSAALFAWVKLRRYLRACTPARRLWLVILCWALPVTLLVVFAARIR